MPLHYQVGASERLRLLEERVGRLRHRLHARKLGEDALGVLGDAALKVNVQVLVLVLVLVRRKLLSRRRVDVDGEGAGLDSEEPLTLLAKLDLDAVGVELRRGTRWKSRECGRSNEAQGWVGRGRRTLPVCTTLPSSLTTACPLDMATSSTALPLLEMVNWSNHWLLSRHRGGRVARVSTADVRRPAVQWCGVSAAAGTRCPGGQRCGRRA